VQYHASRQEIHNGKQNIIFYALCVLYMLTVALITLQTGQFVVAASVSNNAESFFHANQLCAQINDVSIPLHMAIAEGVSFGCCDFIAQCILVRTTDNGY
jgi:hypothetical protein